MAIENISASISGSGATGGTGGSGGGLGAFGAGAFEANAFQTIGGGGGTSGVDLVGIGVLRSTVSAIAIISAQMSAFAYSTITIPGISVVSAGLTGLVFMSAALSGQSLVTGDLTALEAAGLSATLSGSSAVAAALTGLASGSAGLGGSSGFDVLTKRRAGGAPGYGGWWDSAAASQEQYQRHYERLRIRVDFVFDGTDSMEEFVFDTYPLVASGRLVDLGASPSPSQPEAVVEMVSMEMEEVRVTGRLSEAA